jgi:RNA polymerase sigma factor (sigma-70 family)
VTVLRADEHFEALRGPVWARVRGRVSPEDFDDAWSEAWARVLARGGAVDVEAPVAYMAEAVQRVLIDEHRARARGLARGEKASLEVGDLDDHVDLGALDDTAAEARYAAVVHRVLDIVRDRLSDRELRVFVATFLYLQSTPETAAALGLSEPRVKKDRVKIAAKCGEAVWPLLSAELGCSAARKPDLGAGFEVMADHVEECSHCADLRRNAFAILGPVELLALPHGPLDALTARLFEAANRLGDFVSGVPPAGRTAAVAGVAAALLAGGATVALPVGERHDPPRFVVRAPPTPAPTASPAVTATAPLARVVRRRPKVKKRAAHVAAAKPPLRAPPSPPVRPVAPPASQPATGEFGFERH